MSEKPQRVPRGTRSVQRRAPRALPTRPPPRETGASVEVAATFGADADWATDTRLREIALEQIDPNPNQPRQRFDRAALEQLAASLHERGVLQPVLVRPRDNGRYELIAGERRWRAARLAGLERLPAFIRADTADEAAIELALIENVVREDLSPVEEARTLSMLIDDLGGTKQALADRLGKSRSDVANTIRLLDLPDDTLELLDNGQLTKAHGKALLSEPDRSCRRELGHQAAHHQWSTRQLENAIAANGKARRRRTTRPRPDPPAAASDLADQLAATLHADVHIQLRDDKAELRITYNSLHDIAQLAATLAATPRLT